MGLVDLFIWLMFILAVGSTIATLILIKKHPEIVDKRDERGQKDEDWKIHYWSWPPM